MFMLMFNLCIILTLIYVFFYENFLLSLPKGPHLYQIEVESDVKHLTAKDEFGRENLTTK